MKAADTLLDRVDELLPELERGHVPAWARDALQAVLRNAMRVRGRRRRGMEKTRRKLASKRRQQTEATNAAIARNRLKIALTASDFVDQVLKNFACSGDPPPSAKAVRRWRARQISKLPRKYRKAV